MATKKPGPKILRIGLIQNGRIIEERLMRSADDVTIGSDFDKKKNTLIVPASNLPKSMKLFEPQENGYVLRFTPQMSGRISLGDGVKTLDELVQEGRARKSGKDYILPLTPKARGKVSLGDVTVLFQFVKPPPPRPKPVLPAAMRGGWFKGIEPILAIVIVLSALLQIGTVVWLESQEWPEPKDMELQIEDRFVKIMAPEKAEEPPEPEQTEPDESAEKGEGKTEEKAPEPKKQAKAEEPKEEKPKKEMTAEERAAAEAARRRALAEKVQNKTILKKLGAMGEGGSMVDSLAQGAGETSIEEAFAGSQGIEEGTPGAEKSGIGTAGSADATGAGTTAGIGELGETSGAKAAEKGVGTGQKTETKVKARIKGLDQAATTAGGTLDAASISDVIKRRSGAIQRCYERVLKQNPEAGGKLVIQFTIGTRGRVTRASATVDSVGGGVGSCVADRIKNWRFPRPKGGEVMVSKTFVLEASK